MLGGNSTGSRLTLQMAADFSRLLLSNPGHSFRFQSIRASDLRSPSGAREKLGSERVVEMVLRHVLARCTIKRCPAPSGSPGPPLSDLAASVQGLSEFGSAVKEALEALRNAGAGMPSTVSVPPEAPATMGRHCGLPTIDMTDGCGERS